MGSRAVRRAVATGIGLFVLIGASFPAAAAPGDPGEPIKLNGPILHDDGDVESTNYGFSPDGSTVIYHSDEEADAIYGPLYSVDVGTLDHDRVSAGRVRYEWQATADSGRVIYHEWQRRRLLAADLDGSNRVRLDDADSGSVDFAISPDSTTVYWKEGGRLRAQSVDGGPTHVLVEDAGSRGIWASADADTVLSLRDTGRGRGGNRELVAVPASGGDPVVLSPLAPAGGTVWDATISADSARAVYLAEQDTNGVVELYSVGLDGGDNTRLNAALVAAGDTKWFAVAPDSTTVVFAADQDTNNVRELYLVSLSI